MALFVGLMSGTSLDGVDAALVRFGGEEERPDDAGVVAAVTAPYESGFRARLEEACRVGTAEELCRLDFDLGRRFADAVHRLLEEAGVEPARVEAVGSHGQTVWHAPPGESAGGSAGPGSDEAVPAGRGGEGDPRGAPPGDRAGATLQIGQAAVVAEETGIPVVSDFRVRDVAAGGHGAPLTPYFDRLLLSADARARGILNLGGMANLTALPARRDDTGPVAFDTGPGVALLDAAAHRLSGGDEAMDRDGRRAARGEVLPGALEAWLEDPFFRAAPPRSTGRERFGPRRLEAWVQRHGDAAPDDLMATLTELTARSVAESLRWVDFSLDEVYLCGGGARNPELVRRIGARLEPVPVEDLSALGWDPDAREAAAFALLARQHLLGVAASPAWATGARGARVLGKLTPA